MAMLAKPTAQLLKALIVAASPAVLLVAHPALAAAAGPAAGNNVEEVVVTASRVEQLGFSAPTPTTVVGAADLARVAPLNVTDALTQIPSFKTSLQLSSASLYANLRGIGSPRTLLLVDGRRHVPTFSDGTVDLNVIPEAMISRIEVVTGGASASWGSDAVAGVINIILKNNLEGFEGNAEYGITRYGDDQGYSLSAAAGSYFAGHKGHILIGGEYASSDGVRTLQEPYFARPWTGQGMLGNSAFATNHLPGTIYASDVRRTDVSDGGLITSGPLKGTNFGPGGTTSPFGYSSQNFANAMIGGTSNAGDTPIPGGDLLYPFKRWTVMSHVDYDLTDQTRLFAEGTVGHAISEGHGGAPRNSGSLTATNTCSSTALVSASGAVNVNINNAYLPAAVRSQMLAAGITCFSMGRTYRDPGLGPLATQDGSPIVLRGVVGFSHDLPKDFKVDGYFEYGWNRYQQRRFGNVNIARLNNAIDAVNSNGQPVCRINADASTANDDPACAPMNIFGAGSPSAASTAYVTGTSTMDSDTHEAVAALNLHGTLWSPLSAGRIGLATGAEARREDINTRVDALSQANGWSSGNRKAIRGAYSTRELYGELAVPLLKDVTFAKAVELQLAGRYTDYSSSGGVNTWKAGATWDISDQVRLRVTRSRDIRAGNLGELFTATAVQITPQQDPRTAATYSIPVTTTGNRSLQPEVAYTNTAGIVFSPEFLPRFRLSIDYYDINITGQIGTISANQVLINCFTQHIDSYCANITQSGTTITGITVGYQNLDHFETDGVDIEANYTIPGENIWRGLNGRFTAHVLANYVGKLATKSVATAAITDPAGQYNNPHWTVFGTLGYEGDKWNTSVEGHWYEGGTVDNTKIEGLAAANGINDNSVGATFYTNGSIQYSVTKEVNAFLRVTNIFDVPPPFPELGTAMGSFWDYAGRTYRIGARFKY